MGSAGAPPDAFDVKKVPLLRQSGALSAQSNIDRVLRLFKE
jgi:hypothetical protein